MSIDANAIRLSEVAAGPGQTLCVTFAALGSVIFNLFWLRDNCPTGFHPATGERTFDLLSLPDDLSLRSVGIDQTNGLELLWRHDAHVSRFSAAWLWEHRPGRRRDDPADIQQVLWRAADIPNGPLRHDASEILQDDAALRHWMRDTQRFGLTLVDNIRGGSDAGVAIARRCGLLRETNFGVTFEVVNKPDPNNLAYTAIDLPLHTDLPNQDLPPGFQFLHCIANDAHGGGSITADGFAIAEALRHVDPASFDMLAHTAVPYRFFDRHFDIRTRRPVIGIDADGKLCEIAFNAHIADLVDLPCDIVSAWYRAYRAFMHLTRDPAFRLTFRLTAGQMIAFDNRRVLHGRESFDPSTGVRHLHGCYVDRGEFNSRLRLLG